MMEIGPYFFCDDSRAPAAPTVMEIGVFTLDCARIVVQRWPKARYVAVEPFSANYRALLKAIAAAPNLNVEPYRCALADSDGQTTVYDLGHEQLASTFPRHETEGMKLHGRETVQGLALRSLLGRCEIKTCDLLLLNCEGAEVFALDALNDDAGLRERVPQVCTSFHCDHVRIYPPARRDRVVRALARWYDVRRGSFEPIPYYLFSRKS